MSRQRSSAGEEQAPPRPTRGGWSPVLVNLLNPNAWAFSSLVGGPILAGALCQAAPHPLAHLGGLHLVLGLAQPWRADAPY